MRLFARRRSEKSAEAIVAAGARRRRAEHEKPNRHKGFDGTQRRRQES